MKDILIRSEWFPLTDSCFTLFVCSGPCHLSSVKQCSEKLVYLVTESIKISVFEFLFLSTVCKVQTITSLQHGLENQEEVSPMPYNNIHCIVSYHDNSIMLIPCQTLITGTTKTLWVIICHFVFCRTDRLVAPVLLFKENNHKTEQILQSSIQCHIRVKLCAGFYWVSSFFLKSLKVQEKEKKTTWNVFFLFELSHYWSHHCSGAAPALQANYWRSFLLELALSTKITSLT